MCNAVSFVITINDIFHSMSPRESESHSRIMERHGIVNDEHEIRGVSVEITPPGYDFSLPFSEWIFKVDQDLLPDWFSAEEAELACRKKLPVWKELHTIKDGEEHMIGGDDDDYCCGLVFEGSPKIAVNNGGWCYTYNNSSPNVTVNIDGVCRTNDCSSPTVTVNKGGTCYTRNESSPNVTLNSGWCCTYDNSSANVTVNKGGWCYTYHGSSPIVVVNEGGECRSWGESKPNVTVNKGGICEKYNSTAKIIYNN